MASVAAPILSSVSGLAAAGLAFVLTWVGQGVLFLLVLGNPLSPLTSWYNEGWTRSNPDEVDAIDFIAAQLRSEGRDHASIGYQIYFSAGEAVQHSLDSRYKVGVGWDFLFRERYGITNVNRCAEGISPDDEYRIVQTNRYPAWTGYKEDDNPIPDETMDGYPRKFFATALPPGFQKVQTFGSYQVFQRN
jgi:hypothetical protein